MKSMAGNPFPNPHAQNITQIHIFEFFKLLSIVDKTCK